MSTKNKSKLRTFAIREEVLYYVEAESADEAEQIFLDGELNEFFSSVEDRTITEHDNED